MGLKINAKTLLAVTLVITSSTTSAHDDKNHRKRQIYREQVLPHAGGRIPDTAFETDRLFLNRLQKEGIAVPDGVVLEQRNPQVFPFHSRDHRTVFRIALSSDARFISKEGRYQHNEVPTVETTYLYPQIHGQKVTLTPPTPAYPVYRQFNLHNSQLNQLKLQPKKKAQLLNITPVAPKGPIKPLKSTSYLNFNIIHESPRRPLATAATTNIVNAPGLFDSIDKHYLPSYGSDSLFSEFNHYFNNFDLYQPNVDGSINDLYGKEHTIDLPTTGFGSSPVQPLY